MNTQLTFGSNLSPYQKIEAVMPGWDFEPVALFDAMEYRISRTKQKVKQKVEELNNSLKAVQLNLFNDLNKAFTFLEKLIHSFWTAKDDEEEQIATEDISQASSAFRTYAQANNKKHTHKDLKKAGATWFGRGNVQPIAFDYDELFI